jgi:hypothetical protein
MPYKHTVSYINGVRHHPWTLVHKKRTSVRDDKVIQRTSLQEQLGGLLYDFSLYTRQFDATGLDLPYHIYERILNEMEES